MRDGRRLVVCSVPGPILALGHQTRVNDRRIGRQAADWPVRMQRDREMILRELESLARDERIAKVFDFPRLIADLSTWDGEDRPEREDAARIVTAVTRGVATARFVRFAEGRNA